MTNVRPPNRTVVPIVAPDTFLLATRDTGYRSASAALSELIDNSLQAGARSVRILARECGEFDGRAAVIGVVDDGKGMSAATLGSALQFGGTDRFGDRSGLGRFGMGLPNSSMSQSRCLEVYSWQRPGDVLYTYLDIDEVVAGRLRSIPKPRTRALPDWMTAPTSPSGTLVLWTRCGRLGRYRLDTLVQKVQHTLGRVYRYAIWNGARISINDRRVERFDPLLVDARAVFHGARVYGAPLRYEIRTEAGSSTIEVRFAELPVAKWHRWGADDKRRKGIVAGAGVSIVRAGREIDYGWHLLGGKRRENYDDWWRCEIRFMPDLDELFGVTHSKQGVTPRTELKLLLSPDLEAVARTLNRRVRDAFDRAKIARPPVAASVASKYDALLSPPASTASRTVAAGGLRYRLEYKQMPVPDFYGVRLSRGCVIVTVNTDHPFFTEMYQRASHPGGCGLDRLERLVLAAARADLDVRGTRERQHTARLRRAWSDALAAFLSR